MTLYIVHCTLYRIPEIVFKGSDVWIQMDDDEMMDVKDLLTRFLISSVMERLFHAVLEVHHDTLRMQRTTTMCVHACLISQQILSSKEKLPMLHK